MKKQEIFLPSRDGITKLHGFLWTPEEVPVRAVLQMTHGMMEYIDRYDPFASWLTGLGYAVLGHDHLGHGRSLTGPEKLGFFAKKKGNTILIDDIHLFTTEAKRRYPGVPCFLLGHSMGSFLTRRYLRVYGKELSGAILMGTGYIPLPTALLGLLISSLTCIFRGPFRKNRLLPAIVLGKNNRCFAPNRTDLDWLSRNDANVDRYIADPLCGFPFTASAYRDFFRVLCQVACAPGLGSLRRDFPLLITSGELDPVGGASACRRLLAELRNKGFTDTTLLLFPEDRHEILNETDSDRVFEAIGRWLDEKTN